MPDPEPGHEPDSDPGHEPPPSPAHPMRPPRRWLRIAFAVLGVVLLGAGATSAVLTFRENGAPSAVVRGYFEALAAGNAGSALAAGVPGAVPEAGHALVSAAVVRATARTAPLSALRVDPAVGSGSRVVVAVSYHLGGRVEQDVSDHVPLIRTRDGWRLERPALAVTFTLPAASRWANVITDSGDDASTRIAVPTSRQLVFPGAVPVTFQTPVLELDADSRVVRFDDAADDMSLRAGVTSEAAAGITDTVRTAFAACLRADADPYCPQPDPGRAGGVALRSVPRSLTGTVVGDPPPLRLAVASGDGNVITVAGTVTVSGSWSTVDYNNVATTQQGSTSVELHAAVPIGAPQELTWDRG